MTFHIVDKAAWSDSDRWHGEFEGAPFGCPLSFIFNEIRGAGEGPAAHFHNYDEAIIVRSGKASVTVDGTDFEISEGQTLIVRARSVHSFRNLGPGRLVTIDIHASEHFKTFWI